MADEIQYFVHDTNFVEAFANVPHRVLGKRLDPFCLWHQFNLEITQSRVLLGAPLTHLDLWQFVTICTSPWTQAHYVPDLRLPSMLRLLYLGKRYDLATEVKRISDYLVDFSARPKLWPNNHEQKLGNDRDFDENLELALHLVKEGSFTWREVWTMPLGVLHWNSTGLAKLAGAKVDIWTPEHEEMFQAHKAKREARIDEEGKKIAEAEGISFEAARKKAHDAYWAEVRNGYAIARQQPQHR